MNKLICLTGLLTALLFIGTAHGGPYYKKTSELEQQVRDLMQDSDVVMETFDEEDEMADIQVARMFKLLKASSQAGPTWIVRHPPPRLWVLLNDTAPHGGGK